MFAKLSYICLIAMIATTSIGSCARVNIPRYYHRNQSFLDSIQQEYRLASHIKPFSIEFTDRNFERVSLELITDTLTYIYEFWIGEDRMQDTLAKFNYNPVPIYDLITRMRSINCTWINTLDYYAEEKKQSLIYVSLWPRAISSPFINKKYYILAYFNQPQYFDDKGILLSGRRLKRVRRINAEVFKKLGDSVAYTISDRFR